MREDYEKLFASLEELEPSKALYNRLHRRIDEERRLGARIRLVFLGAITLVSCILLVPALQYASGELAQSGFTHYLSLLFSDGGIVITYWKEFLLSLAESLPLVGITTSLLVVFVFLWSLKLGVKNIKFAFLSAKTTYSL